MQLPSNMEILIDQMKMANLDHDRGSSPANEMSPQMSSRSAEESGYSSACTPSSSFGSCEHWRSFGNDCTPNERPSRCHLRKRDKHGAIFPSMSDTENWDFLELAWRHHILDKVAQYLSPLDIYICSLVSKQWHRILTNSNLAKEKLNTLPPEKENLLHDVLAPSRAPKRHFGTPLNSCSTPLDSNHRQPDFFTPSPLLISPKKISRIDRFEAYRMTGNALRCGEGQLSCPRCSLPARKASDTLGVCTNCKCRFQFCPNCLNEEHKGSKCRLLITPEKLIGPRRLSNLHYRRNMRRLSME